MTTELTRLELADLPRLTRQQFDYVQGVANGETLSDAARVAYPKCKLWSPGAQWAFASKLKKNSKVLVWLKHLTDTRMDDVRVTRQGYLNRLVTLMNGAIAAGNLAVAVRAWELVGKVEGLYVKRIQEEPPRTPQELEAALAEVQKRLAEQEGGLPGMLTRH